MESLSRPNPPPHRRKHSTITNASSSSSFSFKGPYDDVLLSKGGKTKFEAHEYAEIFSGSSSIPVLDISALSERVGPGDFRCSKPDYSNIFGVFKDDDVALPYEQLFNGDVNKTKTRIPADVKPHFHKLSSVNSSAKIQRSSSAFNQSIDGVKQQFNVAFNKTSQRNSDESNGKTHIEQLHAVPGSTHFVDETPPLQNKELDRPKLSMKREVSRTWSFSSGIEPLTIKGGIAQEKSHISDKSCNMNGIYPKSHTSKGAPPSRYPSCPNDKDLRQSSLPSFASKDASRKSAGEYSPSLLDEEFDENSVAAVSAAALKKAIEQAQEIIRIAKNIMEKRKGSLKDGSKPSSKNHLKVEDNKESTIHQVSDASKQNNERENVEVANDHAVAYVGKKSTPSCSQREILKTDEKVEVENVRHGGPAEACGEMTNFTGLEANAICRTVTFKSGKVDACLEQMETGKETLEQSELTVHQPKWTEVVSEMVESDPNTPQSVKELEKSVNEAFKQCQAPFVHMAPKIIAEQSGRVLSSEIIQEDNMIMHEGEGNLSLEDELTGDCSTVADKEKCEKNFVGPGELDCMEKQKLLKSEFDKLQNESQTLVEQAAMDKEPENVVAWKENDKDGKSSEGEENEAVSGEEQQWFESELYLTESVEEEIISQMEPEIYQGGDLGIKVNVVYEQEINDTALNLELEEHGQNKIADNSESEADETIHMETDNYSEVLNVEELFYAHRGAGRSEENIYKFELQEAISGKDIDKTVDARCNIGAGRNEENMDKFEEAISGEDIDETVDAHCNVSGTAFSDGYTDNTSAIFIERQESSDVDLNSKVKYYQADIGCCQENDSWPLKNETFLAVEDNKAGRLFRLEVNEMPGTESLCRCALEAKSIESQPNCTFEGLFSDSKSKNVDLIDSDHEETMFETTCEIHNAAQEYASATNIHYVPNLHNIDNKERELLDDKIVKPVFERTSESDEESLFTSILENTDKVSAHEAQACRENVKDTTPNRAKGKDHHVITSDEREYIGEQSERLHSKDQSGELTSQSNCEPKQMDKSMEAEREVEICQDMEKNIANPRRTFIMGLKDAKGNDQKSETNDHQQRIEAMRRGREREKDRMVVERVIQEARERAFADARQRAMAEARGKLEKASVENKNYADKVSNEAKLRAERAAVERATAEARERALEKAMSQKTYTEARTQAQKYSTERFSSSSRNHGLKHGFSSSDVEKSDGASSESALRRKARLERHQRIMERAAKALAEKNARDLLAQKEQAERNRLAEFLDADIKRWATGKEGNLRALLSTLQYILGPDSGWQPVSLTEIITTAAVKKAYRKSTLCVHPDKLQQRGASIQQKYICEKVFDLLKAAWNRFDSEER